MSSRKKAAIECLPQRIDYIEFDSLKGLRNVRVDLTGNDVTAILGENGVGKTTILQALACSFRGVTLDEHTYKFVEFFKRVDGFRWLGSKYRIGISEQKGRDGWVSREIVYSKAKDRWKPRKDKHPQRHVFYIGLMSCVPDIEKVVSYVSSFKIDNTIREADDCEKWIRERAGEILNRKYDSYEITSSKGRKFKRVKRSDGVQYTSLAMGAGEQRLLDFLKVLQSVPKNSLLLIDEIDITLHHLALRRLVKVIVDEAKRRKLQVVFTTHREEIAQCPDINIRYIWSDKNGVLYAMNGVNADALYRLTGNNSRQYRIFVEDDLAAAIVRRVLSDLKMSRFVEVSEFGAIDNAFVVVSGLEIAGLDISKMIFVLDGDMYNSEEQRRERIQKCHTGTEPWREERREKTLRQMRKLILPEGMSPERYLIQSLKDCESEYADIASEINVEAGENHAPMETLIERLGVPKETVYSEVARLLSQKPMWSDYTREVREWLQGLNLVS